MKNILRRASVVAPLSDPAAELRTPSPSAALDGKPGRLRPPAESSALERLLARPETPTIVEIASEGGGVTGCGISAPAEVPAAVARTIEGDGARIHAALGSAKWSRGVGMTVIACSAARSAELIAEAIRRRASTAEAACVRVEGREPQAKGGKWIRSSICW